MSYQIDALLVQSRVVRALILRDMRTRHGRTFFGLFFVVLRPLFHLLLMTAIFLGVRARTGLIGTNATVFWATGLLPYILCLYPARAITTSLHENRPLLHFPIVKSFDVILARSILEIVIAFWVTTIYCALLVLFGVDIVPLNFSDAVFAILATIYLGFSLGWIGTILWRLVPGWSILQGILFLVLYFTAGIFFIPASLPPDIQNVIWFNPLLHAVEWLRSAYYEGYGYGILNKFYLFGSATGMLFLGMLFERGIRGKILERET